MPVSDWEKPQDADVLLTRTGGRWKYIVGGILMLASVAYLLVSGTVTNTHPFTTVEQIAANPQDYVGETVRVTGAVIGRGDMIDYNQETLDLRFTIAHVPEDYDNLAEALFIAANDTQNATLEVFMENEVKPDLLRHEAQAILTGTLGEDGVFYATELLLKCPSRFEDGGSRDNLEDDHPGMQFLENAG